MKVKVESPLVLHLITLAYLLSFCFESPMPCSGSPLLLNRSSFPSDFLFGVGSSAYQYEGATNIEGRTPSVWDTFTKDHPERIADRSNGDVATNFYFHYKEDIALMKEIGLESFRFSISWSRVLPKGRISGGVNQKGLSFYNNLIDELISNGIEPSATLLHFDLPQVLEDEYGGLLSPKIVKDYVDYADFCFKEFGDRVKYWVTFNEPEVISQIGYGAGRFPPTHCSDFIGNCSTGNSGTEPYIVAHHLILSHASAVKLYRENYQAFQNGLIGISISTSWAEPKFETISSKKAAYRYLDFQFGWIFNPLIYGNYPKTMRDLVGDRLPKFTRSQSQMIKGSTDFLGLNYYKAYYADNDNATWYNNSFLNYYTDRHVNMTTEKNGIPIGEPAGTTFPYMYPVGIRKLLLYIKKRYNSPIIYISENGVSDQYNSSSPLNDGLRIKYYYLHLSYLLEAIKDGVDVRGYYAWSFLDNFEWTEGYTARFGMVYVDHKNGLKRSLKNSAIWFKNFLQNQDASIFSS